MSIYFMIIGLLIAVVTLIIVGRKIEEPVLPGLATIVSVGYLVYNTVILNTIKDNDIVSQMYLVLAASFAMLLISFLAYLWVDSINAKKNNKKSYDDSLDWFWNKV